MEDKLENIYFLKCNSCGHLNELRTETILFCKKCNRKLGNNFIDWQAAHPENTFEDFKSQKCVLTSESIEKPNVKKDKNTKLWYWSAFAAVFIISFAIAYFFSGKVFDLLKSEKLPEQVIQQEWEKKQYGSSGLSLQVPFKLTTYTITLSEGIMTIVKKIDSYKYESADGFMVMVICIQYKPQFGVLDLQEAAGNTTDEIMNQLGTSNFDFEAGPLQKGDISGVFQKGSFIKNGIEFKFINAMLMKELRFWQVMASYKPDDKNGKEMAERIIDSIEIKQ